MLRQIAHSVTSELLIQTNSICHPTNYQHSTMSFISYFQAKKFGKADISVFLTKQA